MTYDYLDMSLLKNQQKVAVALADTFTVEELEEINLDDLVMFSSTRDVSRVVNYIYDKFFVYSGNRLELIDIFILNKYPVERFITISISNSDGTTEFNCKNSKKFLQYMTYSIILAINYIRYKSDDDKKISNVNIISNYAKKLFDECGRESLEELIFVNEYILSSEDVRSDNYRFEFSLGKHEFMFYTYKYYIKFGFDGNFIYFPKNKIGYSQSEIIIKRALSFDKK